ncbi:MAG: DUF4003 family protein [Myxococcales bacterium]|nr:DUF4003 family protein [Myxococcales bacterium]
MAPFRDDLVPVELPDDPLARFVVLHEALDAGRRFMGDRVPLRYAAITVLTTPGEPRALAEAIRAAHEELGRSFGWFTTVESSVRMVLAAQLVKYGDSPAAFVAELTRARALLRQARLRRGGVYEVLAVLVLRRVLGGAPIQAEHVLRFGGIYQQLKRHHWLLTGPDDYPACAMLVGQPGPPKQVGDEVEAIFQALRRDAKLWSGEPLQTAASVLALSRLAPAEAAQRFVQISAGLQARGYRVRQRDYDEVAVLCFLATPVDKIVGSVLGYLDRIRESLRWVGKPMGLSLATSLAFVRLVGDDARRGPLADAKLLLDMQAIVAARQAAAGAAAAS